MGQSPHLPTLFNATKPPAFSSKLLHAWDLAEPFDGSAFESENQICWRPALQAAAISDSSAVTISEGAE